MSTIVLQVEGMHCAACVKHVTRAVEGVAGVQGVRVDLEAGRATVEGSADVSALAAALHEAGYPATVDPSSGPV